MARKKHVFGKIISAILIVILVVAIVDAALFLFVEPQGSNLAKNYDMYGFKQYVPDSTGIIGSIAGVSTTIYYKYNSTSVLGQNSKAIEYAEAVKANAPYVVVYNYTNEATCKQDYEDAKAKQKENNEKAKDDTSVEKDTTWIVRRGTKLAKGNFEGIATFIVCPF